MTTKERKSVAEQLAAKRAAIVAAELSQKESIVSQGQNVPIRMLDRGPSVFQVVAIAGQLLDYSKINTVMATLDRVNPELIVIGDANGPDRMARAWAITRERPFIEIPADWDQLGAAAGPLRSQKILDVTRKIAQEEGKSMALFIFMNEGAINSYPARNIRPVLNAAEERNKLFRKLPGMGHLTMPIIFGDPWMEEDFLAANPKGELGEIDLPMPTVRRPAIDPDTGEILPDNEVQVLEVNDTLHVDADEVAVVS